MSDRQSGWLCKGILPNDANEAVKPPVEPKIEPALIQITQAMLDQVVETAGHTCAVKWLDIPTGQISDGYHTFDELYEHRIELFMALCSLIYYHERGRVWMSLLHSDGSSINGWFVLGIDKEAWQQITYHLPMKYWDRAVRYAKVLDRAYEWDGHTSNDVLDRLKRL